MKNVWIVNYIRALVNLYGIVPKDKVVEIFNVYRAIQIDSSDIDMLINSNILNNEHFAYIDGYFVQESITYDGSLNYLLGEQQNKTYYIPDEDEFLKYVDDLYFEKNKEYRKLKSFIKKNFIHDEQDAEELCEDLKLICKREVNLRSLIFEFERRGIEFESEQQVGKLMNLLMDFANSSRGWENKGHTPKEMNKLEYNINQTQRKVGRNEPCPCGSGKKYKKCCGSN